MRPDWGSLSERKRTELLEAGAAEGLIKKEKNPVPAGEFRPFVSFLQSFSPTVLLERLLVQRG